MHEILLDIRLRLLGKEYKNEEHVRLSLVARVVQALGWDIWNPTEVYTEFKATKKEDNTRVDMALFTPGFEATAIFIECKSVGAFATDLAAVERQLRDYNRDHTALFTIITDGRHWRFYFSFTSGEFKDKLFCKFDLQQDGLDEIVGYLETFLHRESITNYSARQKAEAYLMLGKKERAMQDVLPDAQKRVLMPPFPSLPQAMVQLLAAKILTITPAEAQAFLMVHSVESGADFTKSTPPTAKTALPVPKAVISAELKASTAFKESGLKKQSKSVVAASVPLATTAAIEFVLLLNRAGIKAIADWCPVTRRLCVRAGSTAMLENRESLGLGNVALRQKLIAQKVLVQQADQLEFQQEYLFESIMQAAQVICGYSVNGKQAWRDLAGKPLADYVN